MAILTRISRLFRADLHALLDYIEEPEILLRQALREMEEEIDQGRQRLQQLQRELTTVQGQVQTLQEKTPQFDQEITACFDANNTILAKNFIRRKLENQSLSQLYTNRITKLTAMIREKNQILIEQQGSYDGLKQKSDLLIKENKHWSRCIDSQENGTAQVLEDQVELEFLKEQKRFQLNSNVKRN